VNLANTKTAIATICDGLNKAKKDAKAHKDKGSCQAALCFIAPWINERHRSELKRCWNRVIRDLKPVNGRPRCDALLLINSKEPIHEGRRLYPGIALLVKQVTGKAA
jgi:hypothetical protein